MGFKSRLKMKKNFISMMIAGVFLFALFSNAEAEIVREVGKKWDSVSVAPNTSWEIVDKDGQSVTEIKPSMNPNSGQPVKHTFQFVCPTATVINLQVKFNGITKVHALNGGAPIGSNNGNNFSFMLQPGMTYNIQHKTAAQNCSVVITESFNVDL